jgi:hypothetical protein
MKKLFFLLIASALIGGAAIAQDPQQQQPPQQQQKDPKAERAEWDKKIKDELKLSADQVSKYDALSKEYGDKIDALLSDATLTKEQQKEKKMALKKEKETRLGEFLTPEQQTKYREIVERKKAEKG